MHEGDKISEQSEDGSSMAGLSDEGNASLVGFGEGASSTVSGPVSTSTRIAQGARAVGRVGSPLAGRQHSTRDSGSPMQGVETQDAKMLDGMTYDQDVLDTTPRNAGRAPRDNSTALAEREQAEHMMRESFHSGGQEETQPLSNTGEGKGLGKFPFED